MKPLKSLEADYSINGSLISLFNTYIEITTKSMDKIVAQSLTNGLATNAFSQQNTGPTTVYNNFDVAYAVGLTFKIIVEQNIEVFEYIDSICQPIANEYQKYALSLLKYIVYQLDKRDPETYLKNIFANKNIPAQPLDNKGINLSKIYTFVHLCGLGELFKQFQQLIKYKFWDGVNNQGVNPAEIQDSQLFFYQAAPQFPILVLIQETNEQILKKVFEQHTIFIKNIAIQLLLDSMNQPQSQTIENLKVQPFRFQNLEELSQLIFMGQQNFQEKVAKFIRIPSIEQTLAFLLEPNLNYALQLQKIKEDQEKLEIIQESAKAFDPFKTITITPQVEQIRQCPRLYF